MTFACAHSKLASNNRIAQWSNACKVLGKRVLGSCQCGSLVCRSFKACWFAGWLTKLGALGVHEQGLYLALR